MAEGIVPLTARLSVFTGGINVGILVQGRTVLLVDFGGGGVLRALAALGLAEVERVLLTHYHRDQIGPLACTSAAHASLAAPEAERHLIEQPEAYWHDPGNRWHGYTGLARRLVPTRPMRVAEGYWPGDRFSWGAAEITVLSTPGHTDGSVSYQVDVDGRRVIFSGDLIAGPGQIWDLHSLQRGGVPLASGGALLDYHGFMGAAGDVLASLTALRSADADILVPSHGVIMHDPAAALDALAGRLRDCYQRYAAISSLRHHHPEAITAGEGAMPFGQLCDSPDFVREIGTTRVLLSEEGPAFVLDCGTTEAVGALKTLLAEGGTSGVEGLWITHYHDDHVNACDEFLRVFPCEVHADPSVADVIERPSAYHLPCLSPTVVPVSHRTRDGERWRWREFTLTAFHFPGQTLHHGGLLVEGHGRRLFFVGDSFSPAGIDDYCPTNRNPLGPGVGFDRCLHLLRELRPDCLINQHISVGFAFTGDQYEYMLANLSERERVYGAVLPWEHPNFGLDPDWARCYPYEQTARRGERVAVGLRVTNHARQAAAVIARPVLPPAWRASQPCSTTEVIAARSDGELRFIIDLPQEAPSGLSVLPFSVTLAGRELGYLTEALIDVAP
jgi:glyoxylase-like metal-dependent hydrolase (beta-lactamase superfamily II)